MALITGILMLAMLVSLIALLVDRSKTSVITFMVAVVLWLVSAAITGNVQ